MKKVANKLVCDKTHFTMYDIFSKEVSRFKVLKDDELMAKFNELNSLTNYADRERVKCEILYGTLYLVLNAVWRYGFNTVLIDELTQAGSMGLLEAIDKFDIAKGSIFEAYARMWMNKCFDKVFKDSTIHIPTHYGQIKSLIQRAEKEFEKEHHCLPCEYELAEMTGVDMCYIRLYRFGGDLMAELPRVRYNDDDDERHGTFKCLRDDDVYVDFFDRQSRSERKDFVRASLMFLSDKQRYVIEQYCGMNPQRVTYSFAEIGKEMGMTDVAVGKLYRRGIAKLRNSPLLHDLYEEANTRDPYLNY